MKNILSILMLVFCVSNTSHAEWQLVNENDPTDKFLIFADFHNVTKNGDGEYQIPIKTSTLPDSVTSSFPMKIYEPFMSAVTELNCEKKIILTANANPKIYGKMTINGQEVDILKQLGLDKKKQELTSHDIVETDIVDMNLYNRLCKH